MFYGSRPVSCATDKVKELKELDEQLETMFDLKKALDKTIKVFGNDVLYSIKGERMYTGLILNIPEAEERRINLLDDIDKKNNVTTDADPNKVCISKKEYERLVEMAGVLPTKEYPFSGDKDGN